jgi:regulator of nucleoside diphosphate kinase
METATMLLHELLLSLTDAEALSAMLDGHRRGASPESDPAEALAELLSQARRVPDGHLPDDRVAMGSTVTYVDESSGARRTVSLAYPADADLALGRISVLSPIGRALIGRKRGDIVDAMLPGGRIMAIRVLATQPLRQALREAA